MGLAGTLPVHPALAVDRPAVDQPDPDEAALSGTAPGWTGSDESVGEFREPEPKGPGPASNAGA